MKNLMHRRTRYAVWVALGIAGGLVVGSATVRAQDNDSGTESQRHVVRLAQGGVLDLSNLSGRIVVTGGGGDEVVIDAIKRVRGASGQQARDLLAGVRVDVIERPGRVIVRTIHRPLRRREPAAVGVDYTVLVPGTVDVELRSVSGDIELRDLQGEARSESTSGDLQLADLADLRFAKTIAGDIDVTDVASSRDTTLATVGGDVRVRGLRAPRVEVMSVSGNVDLRELDSDRLEARTMSGSVGFRGNLARGGRYDLSSHSGNVVLTIDATGFDVNATTFAGTITSDFPSLRPSDRENRSPRGPPGRGLRGVVGDGGAMIEVRSFSGSIRIDQP